jgi:hypothetical protein
MRKNLFFAVASLSLLAACCCPDYHYAAYVGAQKNWTTSDGAFARTVEGIPFYTQYPSRPYELVGSVHVKSEKALARAVKYYHADAALIYGEVKTVDGAVVVAGPGPAAVFPTSSTYISANLLRFKK